MISTMHSDYSISPMLFRKNGVFTAAFCLVGFSVSQLVQTAEYDSSSVDHKMADTVTRQKMVESRSRKRSYLLSHLSMDSRQFQWIRQQEWAVTSTTNDGGYRGGSRWGFGLGGDWGISAGSSHVKTDRESDFIWLRRIGSCNPDE